MPADPSERPVFEPDAVAGKSFTQARRGYEPDEVRAFLLSVASQIRDAKLRYEDMERRLVEVERRAADPRDLDETAVTQLLGEETARVLETARNAAADIRNRAEAEADARAHEIAERDRSTREAADRYSEQVRGAADETDRRLRAEAERFAEELRASAETETTAQRAAADDYSQRIRVAADAEAAELRSTSTAEAERLRSEAASVLTERTAEAETAASAILGEADGYNTRVRADADRYSEATRAAADSYRSDAQAAADTVKVDAAVEAERLVSEATDEALRIREEALIAAEARAVAADAEADNVVQAAKDQGRTMVEEARAYRERVIVDLADRRRSARSQLEDLAATRDALAVTLSDVESKMVSSRRLLDETTIDLTLLGDVATDRSVLEADDQPPTAIDPVEAGSGDPHDADDSSVDNGSNQADDPGGAEFVEAEDDEAGSVEVEAEAVVDRVEDLPGTDGEVDAVGAADDADPEPDPEPDLEPETNGPEPAEDRPGQVNDPDGVEGTVGEETDGVERSVASDASSGLLEELPDVTEAGPEALPEVSAQQEEPESSSVLAPEPLPEALPESLPEALPVAADETGDGEGEAGAPGTVDREGRIDALFARIRADRIDEEPATDPVEPGADETPVSSGASTESEAGDLSGQAQAPGDPEVSSEIDTDSDGDTDLLDRRDTALAEVERQLARRLKRVLADEQNETLDLLRRTKGTPTADDVLPNDADHQERYRAAALEDLASAERVGAGFFGEAPQRRADVFDLAGDFSAEILRQIRGQLERAFSDGDDEYEIGERIRACYREWKTQRIAETSRHFVMVAFSRGVAEAAPDDGEFRWLMDDGDQPCPDCDDNQLGGAVRKGSPFPTGDLCPPAHPGCRCLAVPV